MNYLFYSNFCQYSNELLKLIIDNNLKNQFKFICIEDNNVNIPSFITSVPSIIVNNINKLLVGNEAFEWIKLQKYINISTCNSTIKINDNMLPVNKNEINIDNSKISFTYIEDNIDISLNKFRDINVEDNIIKNNYQEEKITLDQQNLLISKELNKRNNDIQILFNNSKFSHI